MVETLSMFCFYIKFIVVHILSLVPNDEDCDDVFALMIL